jgi:Zn-finger nucleic acid-binding protein
MLIVEYAGTEVDFCPACRGCWFDEGELTLGLGGLRPASAADIETRGRGQRRCPHCRRRMRLCGFPASRVELDACPRRHGVWLDTGELEILIGEAGGAGGEAGRLARHCAEVFGRKQEVRE